ncbi:MAG: PKD-like family lipoprotein [Aestuariibaculum sp.]
MKIKYIKLKLLSVLSILILGVSCMEDEGNYDYTAINEVIFSNINSKYTINRFDHLEITPNLDFTQDIDGSGNYEYTWKIINDIGGGAIKTVLSSERNLNEPITLLPGNYYGYFFVKDLSTGVEYQYVGESLSAGSNHQYSFDLEVVNSLYEGWLVLSEANGAPRLDMVSKINDTFSTVTDVLGGSTLTLTGSPKFVYAYAYDFNFYGIYVSTSGNGTTKVEPNTFDWIPEYGIGAEFVTSQPYDLEVEHLEAQSGTISFAILDGNAYFYYKTQSLKYSNTINQIGGIPFKVAPMIGKGESSGYAILYDTDNKRFVRSRLGNVSTFAPASSTKFDYNNTEMNLVYIISNNYAGLLGAATFSILKDPATSKFYMAYVNASTSEQVFYGEITATDFDQATQYAINPEFGYLFYTVGNKVYKYDFNLETTDMVLDKGTNEITLIKFHDFFSNKAEYVTKENHLMVCSYTENEGVIEFYSVPELSSQINLETTYTGFGKIKSVSYRER